MLGEQGEADARRRRMDAQELATQTGPGALSAVILGAGIVWAVGAAGQGELGVGDLSAFVAGMTALQTGSATLAARISREIFRPPRTFPQVTGVGRTSWPVSRILFPGALRRSVRRPSI
jgi:hypothetical protein